MYLETCVRKHTCEHTCAYTQVRGRSQQKAPDFLRFKAPSGLDIVAGRSSRENDRVTWGVARERDLWFHARGIGGR